MPRKRRAGRPSLGREGRTQVLSIKISANERRAWERAAGAVSLSEWIRDRIARATVARIEVSHDEGDWHWVAYDRQGRPTSMAGLTDGPELEARVLRAAREQGLSVDGATVEIKH